MARANCNELARSDEQGRTYYEVRAEERCGNQGGPVPMVTSGSWAQQVAVRAESYWSVAGGDGGGQVFPDGTGPGTVGLPTDVDGVRAPNLKKWSLVARWCAIDGNTVDYVSEWFYVGYGGTFAVPIPGGVQPAPFGTGSYGYSPIVKLMYACNDDMYDDNAGWLHIYEQYH